MLAARVFHSPKGVLRSDRIANESAGNIPRRNCPPRVDPTCRTLRGSFEVPQFVDPLFVENSLVFGDVIGCGDYPCEVIQRNGALREAVGTAVDAQATALGTAQDASPAAVTANDPTLLIRHSEERIH